MSAKGRPTENGSKERFIRTFMKQHIDYSDYESFKDAIEQIKYWLECVYMTERIHSLLANVTQLVFELAHGFQ